MRLRIALPLAVLLALNSPTRVWAQNGGMSFWDGWLEKMSGPKFRGREFYLPIGCLQSDKTTVTLRAPDGRSSVRSDVVDDRLIQPWNRYNFDDRANAASYLRTGLTGFAPPRADETAIREMRPQPAVIGDASFQAAIKNLSADLSVTIAEPSLTRTCFSLHAHFARAVERNEVATDVYSRSVELRASWALTATKEALELGTGAGLYEIGDQARFSRHPYVSVFAAAKPGRLLPDGSWAERLASIVRFEGGGRLFVARLQTEDISVLLPDGSFKDHTFYRPTGYVGVSLDLTELIWPWKPYDKTAYQRHIRLTQ